MKENINNMLKVFVDRILLLKYFIISKTNVLCNKYAKTKHAVDLIFNSFMGSSNLRLLLLTKHKYINI